MLNEQEPHKIEFCTRAYIPVNSDELSEEEQISCAFELVKGILPAERSKNLEVIRAGELLIVDGKICLEFSVVFFIPTPMDNFNDVMQSLMKQYKEDYLSHFNPDWNCVPVCKYSNGNLIEKYPR